MVARKVKILYETIKNVFYNYIPRKTIKCDYK